MIKITEFRRHNYGSIAYHYNRDWSIVFVHIHTVIYIDLLKWRLGYQLYNIANDLRFSKTSIKCEYTLVEEIHEKQFRL